MERIRLLFMDVDGTLTDGKIYMGNNGELFKVFNIKDGCAIHDILPAKGIVPVVITARKSEIVQNRCKELGIEEVHQGCRDKKSKMMEVAKKYGIEMDSNQVLPRTAYMGDDIIDLPCMEIAWLKACPCDAAKEVIAAADFVSQYKGGDGAAREFIEWISCV